MSAHVVEFAEHAWAKCYSFLLSSFLHCLTFWHSALLLFVLKHGLSKALPDCHHEHPNLVPKKMHEAHVLLSVHTKNYAG